MQKEFIFKEKNFLIMLIGLVIIATGFVLMSGSSAVAEIIERIKGTNVQG